MNEEGLQSGEFTGQPQDDDKASATAQKQFVLDTWKARDQLYLSIFGQYAEVSPVDYGLPNFPSGSHEAQIDLGESQDTLHRPSGDRLDFPVLNEQQLAIFSYAPDPCKPYWTYVTAGLSSPWLQERPDEVSGLGLELVMKTPKNEPWAVQILRGLGYYVYNYEGLLSPGVRLGLSKSVLTSTDDTNSQIRNLFVWYVDEAPECWYSLPSGGFGLFSVVGITDDELNWADSIGEYGTWCVQELLRQTEIGQVTDAKRDTAMKHENISIIKQSIKQYAENFNPHSELS